MAPSPTTIPTSFVPKQPVRPGSNYSRSGSNVFLMLSFVVFAASVLCAGLVFGYEKYLTGSRDAKAAQVAVAQEQINSTTVEDFIRSRNRFQAANGLLGKHIAASQFIDVLELMTLENVRFDSLSFVLAADGSAEIEMEGTARTFNALAAQSSALASEKRIKRAIFSGITPADTGTAVSFSLDADIDARLLSFSNLPLPSIVEEAVVPLDTVATTTTATTTTP